LKAENEATGLFKLRATVFKIHTLGPVTACCIAEALLLY
jgi:hypothetical protein